MCVCASRWPFRSPTVGSPRMPAVSSPSACSAPAPAPPQGAPGGSGRLDTQGEGSLVVSPLLGARASRLQSRPPLPLVWPCRCALMHAPEAVPPSERGRAGSLMICFLNGAVHVQCIHEARVAYPLSRSHLVRSQVFDIRQVRCAPTRGSSPPAVLHLRTWCMHCTWSCTCMLSGARQHMCKYCAYGTVYMRPDASQHVGYMC